MKPPEFRIAPNDPKLAHAAAYGRIKQLRGDTDKLFDTLQEMKGKAWVRNGVTMLRAHFGKLVLMEDITRLVGSRPKARWLVLDACVDGGSDMVAILVSVNNTGWQVHDLAIRLTAHAVARLMQRTTQSSNLQLFAEVLRYHILASLPTAVHLPEGHTLTTASGPGAMIWVPYDDGIRAATWLGVDSISDPVLRGVCQEAGPGRMAVSITKPNGESAWLEVPEKRVEIAGGITLTTEL